MKIRPLHDRILVQPILEKEVRKGGIIIPDSAKEKPIEGRVKAVGKGKIGDDGKPSGEIDDTMRVYGGGSLTLQLTPWLKATAGVKFLPNGEMEVTARLDAPRYDVFPRKEINKNLSDEPGIIQLERLYKDVYDYETGKFTTMSDEMKNQLIDSILSEIIMRKKELQKLISYLFYKNKSIQLKIVI